MNGRMIRIALYQPDIPQNAGAAMRLCACLGAGLDIIGPCGFVLDDRRIRRAGMDYRERLDLRMHSSWKAFLDFYQGGPRKILLTTKAGAHYGNFEFAHDDLLIAGSESAGVPEDVHAAADARIGVPLLPGLRSLNVTTACAMILGEALRQTEGFPACR